MCKRPASRALGDQRAEEAFTTEGKVLQLLAGDGAPMLVEAGVDGFGPYLVMERVDLPPLASRIGAHDAGWTARAAASIFSALESVHRRGVLHCDVSPGNLLVGDAARRARLVDFGVARRIDAAFVAGPFRGTLLYAAPELARGEPFDARADLFAAAASVLHAHCGEPPRTQLADAAMLLSAGDENIDGWAARASEGLPEPVREALRACCSFDRTRRPASAVDVAARFAAGSGAL
jgi:serine/threonine-protein kinase